MPNKTALTRWFFILVSLFIISLILWNTYQFYNELKESERNKMEIWAAAQEDLQRDLLSDNTNPVVERIIRTKDKIPKIVVNKYNEIDAINIDSLKMKDTTYIRSLVNRFKNENTPIDLSFVDTETNETVQIGTIYYGNSEVLNKLKYYPVALILIIALFFIAIYFFYQTSRSAETNKLWAGMAKETAHQIGTPLSSLVGWTEILKTEAVNPEYIVEMEKDITRLETITERFSKIGSKPALVKADLVTETKTSFDYLKSRSSKLIEFELDATDKEIPVLINPQLYSWTIENLVKNGIDAMKGKGKITMRISLNGKNGVVQITDTGKGIPKRNHSKVFSPGFTTKKRGWGLGLSLAKRIIEGYHNGKIYVLKSTKDVGTTMEIALQVRSNEKH